VYLKSFSAHFCLRISFNFIISIEETVSRMNVETSLLGLPLFVLETAILFTFDRILSSDLMGAVNL